MSVDLPMDKILGLVLMIAGGGWLVVAKSGSLWKWFRSSRATTPGQTGHNTDAPPPDCFGTHVAIIVKAAPTAPPDVLIEYCQNSFTEAQVLLAERTRLEALVDGESS